MCSPLLGKLENSQLMLGVIYEYLEMDMNWKVLDQTHCPHPGREERMGLVVRLKGYLTFNAF